MNKILFRFSTAEKPWEIRRNEIRFFCERHSEYYIYPYRKTTGADTIAVHVVFLLDKAWARLYNKM